MTLVQQLLKEHRATLAARPTVFTGRKALFLVGGPENWTLRPESLVETKDGLRPLSSVKTGDKVYAINEVGIKSLTEVEKVLVKEAPDERIQLELEDGQTFECNSSDKILLESGEWVRVDAVKAGDAVVIK